MVNLTDRIEQEKAFRSLAPGYWAAMGVLRRNCGMTGNGS